MTLHEDGDTEDLDDGRTLQLRIVPDQNTNITDYDCYGEFEKLTSKARPAEAKLLNGYNFDPMWWTPCEDTPPDTLAEAEKQVRDILEYGFSTVGIELLGPDKDFYGHRPVLNAAWLGGIEPLDYGSEYLQEIIAELRDEVLQCSDS